MMENQNKTQTITCAIYTRKSTSEGLDGDFTSLDAQRESAENYILSQKHLGWSTHKSRYDDGGYTGATTDRPALQQLIKDIELHKINCVVVYKVDRLSRSLHDFVKLLKFFEDHQITFVSVTQHFNTNTSMGRLTLNILLSFAQFEREMISERTKDKMGAARRKGKWVGGRCPLGYKIDKEQKKIVIIPKEAELIKRIFLTYIEKKSLLKVAKDLNNKGIKTKIYKGEKVVSGGVPFTNSYLQRIINNVVYIGKVKYGREIYPGEHEAIIEEDLFANAQEILKSNTRERGVSKRKLLGLLSGIFRCAHCKTSMCHGYSRKGPHVYRYYTCLNSTKRGRDSCPTRSISAPAIELRFLDMLKSISDDKSLSDDCWKTYGTEQQNKIIKTIVAQVNYCSSSDSLWITLKYSGQKHRFALPLRELKSQFRIPAKSEFENEPIIRRQLLLAHQIKQKLDNNEVGDLNQVAEWLEVTTSRVGQIMNLLLLCPQIQENILILDRYKIANITERKLRLILKDSDWKNQLIAWDRLT